MEGMFYDLQVSYIYYVTYQNISFILSKLKLGFYTVKLGIENIMSTIFE